MFYQKSVLSNGVTVLSENMPDVRSMTMGIWFRVGSRDETPDEAGMSHFMEHMRFKGTPTRTPIDISVEFDSMGAELNAFTSKEYTCFYARFVDTYLEQSLEILADMLINSTFPDKEVESERKVVIEEIARSEDTPDDYVYDILGDELFPTQTIGRPVLGTRESVGGFTHDDLMAYHDKHYHAANCTVAVAGNVDHAKLVELCEKYLGGMQSGKPRTVRGYEPEASRTYFKAEKKDTEQANLLIGMEGLPAGHDDRYAAILLDTALGGGMSSRLFQEVREKRGLVYSIYASSSPYEGVGSFSIYAGTRLENLPEVVQVTLAELEKMASEGIGQEELDRVRALAVGQTILSMEATRVRMLRIGRNATVGIPLLSLDQTIENYKRVTVEDINRVASQIFVQRPSIAVVSSAEEAEVRELLKDVIEL